MAFVPRVHNYALKTPWTSMEARDNPGSIVRPDRSWTYILLLLLLVWGTFFHGPDVKSFRRTEIQQRQATQVCRVTFIRSSWQYSYLFLRTRILHPIDAGMLNGRILLAPSVQDTPWCIHPVIIKWFVASSCGFRFFLRFFRSAYLLHRHSFTFNIHQGLPIAPQYGSTVDTSPTYL